MLLHFFNLNRLLRVGIKYTMKYLYFRNTISTKKWISTVSSIFEKRKNADWMCLPTGDDHLPIKSISSSFFHLIYIPTWYMYVVCTYWTNTLYGHSIIYYKCDKILIIWIICSIYNRFSQIQSKYTLCNISIL